MSKTLTLETGSRKTFKHLASEELTVSPDVISAERDPLWLIENEKLSIKTKPGRLIPFKLNSIQKKTLNKIKDLRAQNKPVRLWVLKARQEGVSTLIEAIIYAFTSQRQNVNSLICADDVDGSNYLFGMSKLYHQEIDKDFQHDLKYSNEKKLEFKDRYSQILIDTAENVKAGRKYTFQYLHLSEVAFFKKARKLMIGLNQAVPELPGTMIIGESTANGVGGYFFDQWQKAKKKETDWEYIFIPWYEAEEYTAAVPQDFSPTPEEKDLKTRYRLSDGQLQWRRNCIKNKCEGSVDIFNQEYPTNDIDCFLVSGNCRFNTKCLKKMQPISINPGQVGRLLDIKVKGKSHVIFDSDFPDGWLHIWAQPKRGEQFIIGADVAEGIENEDRKDNENDDTRGSDHDYSTAIVLNARTLEQVAEMRCHLEPDVFAEELARLGKFYHNAFMGVERNNHGIAVLQELKKTYFNLFHMETFAEDTQTRSKKLGWITTFKSKPLMIAEADRVIREALSLIHSPELLSELMTFIRLPDGKTEAQEGCFDDLVIAYAIALQMVKYAPLEIQKKEAYVSQAERQEEKSRENYVRG